MALPIDDTIVAISTPLFPSGIGVIRISGPDAIQIADTIFKGKKRVSECASYRALHGYILNPVTKEKLDEALCLVMKQPNTYTGEDVVEIFMHGNPLLLQETITLIVTSGARQAEAGEFTYRAFINGKMSLTQAEAVQQLVHACSGSGLRNAFLQLQGTLQKRIEKLRGRVLEILSEFEAEIEFPEDGLTFSTKKESEKNIKSLIRVFSDLADTYSFGKKIEEGVKIVICGPPNSGKSTLLNRLLNKERAIVHYQPGTTRDIVEGRMVINGAVFRLIDTAGIRETDKTVEEEGIKRTYESIKQADLVLWVDDVIDKNRDSETLFMNIKERFIHQIGDKQILRLLNKSDLLSVADREYIQKCVANGTHHVVSAKRGWGLSRLRRAISNVMESLSFPHYEGAIITSMRQHQLLISSRDCLKRALKGLEQNISLEYICVDLHECIDLLNQFIGTKPHGDIYELIFKNYCIGK